MKKILIIFILTLVISACSLNSKKETGTKIQGVRENTKIASYDEIEFINKINSFKQAGVNNSSGQAPASENNANDSQAGERVQLEDLFTAYDQALIRTNMGNIRVQFYPEPIITVNNFLNLAKNNFYAGTKFHRVIKDFMIQGGCPLSKDDDWSDDGTGHPGYKFQDEINSHQLVRGSLAMANSGPDTNGSQFFIVTKDEASWLDGKHTNFGFVADGMEVVDKIEAVAVNENSHPREDVIIESIELTNSADTYELTDEEKADLNSGIGPELPDEIESDDNKNDKNDGSDENADEEE